MTDAGMRAVTVSSCPWPTVGELQFHQHLSCRWAGSLNVYHLGAEFTRFVVNSSLVGRRSVGDDGHGKAVLSITVGCYSNVHVAQYLLIYDVVFLNTPEILLSFPSAPSDMAGEVSPSRKHRSGSYGHPNHSLCVRAFSTPMVI